MEFTTRSQKAEFRAHLLRTLDLIHGPVRLVLAPSFARALGACVVDATTLKAHGVEAFETLDSMVDTAPTSTVAYLIHGTVDSSARAARHAGTLRMNTHQQVEVYVISFPRTTKIAKAMFEWHRVPDAVFLTLPCAWVPISLDALSLEYDDAAVRELFVNCLNSSLPYDIALALFGGGFAGARTVQARGRLSCKVAEMLRRMRREAGTDLANVLAGGRSDGEIMTVGTSNMSKKSKMSSSAEAVDELILIDRSVDMVTPMCTQLTYEGLLDELLGMRYGQIKDNSKDNASRPPRASGLDDGDPVFREIKDKTFMGARAWVNAALREIQQFRDEQMSAADVSALRGFVSNLKTSFSGMRLHASLLEDLGRRIGEPSFSARQRVEAAILDDTLDVQLLHDIIYKGGEKKDLEAVLRLMCLRCAAANGVAKREFDVLRKDVLNTYGFEHIKTLGRLQEAGVLYERESTTRSAFARSRGPMNLLVDDASKIDADVPDDIHFVYAGYAPWSCRMIEEACSVGWRTRLEDRVPTIHVRQGLADDGSADDTVVKDSPTRPARDAGEANARNIFVMFIGGVTYAEIAALRVLARRDGHRVMVGTTGIVNGTTLVRALMDSA